MASAPLDLSKLGSANDQGPGRKGAGDAYYDRRDAKHILKLLMEDRFPKIWRPSPENRDVRQLLLHRHRLVGMRTRVMNQLQAIAMNEGLRGKGGLWSKKGRARLELLSLAPWTSRRRQELLELLDRLNPMIDELSKAIEQEAARRAEVQLLMTHPGLNCKTDTPVPIASPSFMTNWISNELFRPTFGLLAPREQCGTLHAR
jgi:hypothetical protein